MPQPATGPAAYSYNVLRTQQGDLVDVRTPSSRAQGILRPTAIIEDEDDSHKRYKCDWPSCDKKYDRPSSLEVHFPASCVLVLNCHTDLGLLGTSPHPHWLSAYVIPRFAIDDDDDELNSIAHFSIPLPVSGLRAGVQREIKYASSLSLTSSIAEITQADEAENGRCDG